MSFMLAGQERYEMAENKLLLDNYLGRRVLPAPGMAPACVKAGGGV